MDTQLLWRHLFFLATIWIVWGCSPPPSSDRNPTELSTPPPPTPQTTTDVIASRHLAQAIAHREQGDLAAALASIDTAIAADANRADSWYERGNILFDRALYPQAIQAYSSAIAADNSVADAFFRRGLAHEHQQSISAAIADYSRAIDLAPRHAGALYRRGGLYVERQQFAAALIDLEAASAANPIAADTWMLLADVQTELGQPQAAAESLEHYLRVTQGRESDLDQRDAVMDRIMQLIRQP